MKKQREKDQGSRNKKGVCVKGATSTLEEREYEL